MDFSFTTAHPSPVPVTINGTVYKVPRFLLPEFKARAMKHRADRIKEATAHLDPETKARFLVYYSPPPVDVSAVARELMTPEGVEELLRMQFTAANVPAADIDSLISQADPVILRHLAEELSSAQAAAADLEKQSGEGEGTPETPPNADGGQQLTSAA